MIYVHRHQIMDPPTGLTPMELDIIKAKAYPSLSDN